jgi:excinuclease ABC subunit B
LVYKFNLFLFYIILILFFIFMIAKFNIKSEFEPRGDQPLAIKMLAERIKNERKFHTLLGATGTGKTFTIARLIQEIQKPALIMAPNKTLAAQLYNELKELFPNNSVHYFVSYYDYYQPEAYMPVTGMYIEKDFSVNEEIEKLRLAATHAVRTRRDVIIVATVSCIYGIGDPETWTAVSVNLEVGQTIKRGEIIKGLIRMNYERKEIEFRQGIVRIRGDIIDIFPAYLDTAFRVSLFGDEIESIQEIHPISNDVIKELTNCRIFPATHFIIPEENKIKALESIELELEQQIKKFMDEKRYADAQRIEKRVKFDLEMMREMGWCKGIENYSRHLDGRPAGTPPMCLIDYFPKDFLIVTDESHITIPQIHGMIGGDRSRKKNLVEYGWRLPSAFDNRPLTFEEWESKIKYIVFMSATPGVYELEKSGGISAEQIIRPTGLVDPEVEVRPAKNQIDDLLNEIRKIIVRGGRILITTLTKRMAEDIAEYYSELGIKISYLHSEVETVERFDLLRQLRDGTYDALVGINLLREGLDLPEVQLVAILDADKLGFLRDTRSLIQTIGRASRNVNGRAILYAEKITPAMKEAIDETDRRRNKQKEFNKVHNITPKTIKRNILNSLSEERELQQKESKKLKQSIESKVEELKQEGDNEIVIQYLENKMIMAAKELRFEDAAFLRDKIIEIKKSYKMKE